MPSSPDLASCVCEFLNARGASPYRSQARARFERHPRPRLGCRHHGPFAPRARQKSHHERGAAIGRSSVFVPVFVHSHVRIRRSQDGLTVELWKHPRPAVRRSRWIDPCGSSRRTQTSRSRLQWIERVAIVGRMPGQPPPHSAPRLVSRATRSSRITACTGAQTTKRCRCAWPA
jgi:hypothetical protein